MKLDKFVAVVTYGRSGSTVLQRVLQTIPNSCIRGENNNCLFHLYMSWKSLFTATSKRKKEAIWPGHPWWGIADVNAAAFRTRLARVFLEEVLRPPADASIVGFKEIRYYQTGEELFLFLEFIRDTFTNARFIFLTRDLNEIIKSGWWASRPENVVRTSLQKAADCFQQFARANDEISFSLTHRDLVDRTDVLWQMFDFLETEPNKVAIAKVLTERLVHARQI